MNRTALIRFTEFAYNPNFNPFILTMNSSKLLFNSLVYTVSNGFLTSESHSRGWTEIVSMNKIDIC
jgi:hypothetical protein